MKTPGKMASEVIKAAFLRPATISYPAAPVVMPDRFRGKIRFIAAKCIGCKMCMRDCPTNCITITKVGDKRFQAEFDVDRCIFCAQCVDSCPKDALEATPEFELAQLTRDKLKAFFPAPAAAPAPEAPAAEKPPESKPQ
jgi:formate hydrogenlyase subunit 6/NADH:ubiquinone oxidoreductase subunit I